MFPSFTSVLLVTALTGVWTQDFYDERKTNKKSRAKPQAANIHDGQGKIYSHTKNGLLQGIHHDAAQFYTQSMLSFILLNQPITAPTNYKTELSCLTLIVLIYSFPPLCEDV